MSMLILFMCLNSMSSCDESNAPAVWRAAMTNLTCEERVAGLVNYINSNRLNPVNGYYQLQCRPLEPKA
jgi:hypothetical protein